MLVEVLYKYTELCQRNFMICVLKFDIYTKKNEFIFKLEACCYVKINQKLHLHAVLRKMFA